MSEVASVVELNVKCMSKNSSRSSKKNMIPLYVVFSLSIWITGHTCSDLHTTSLFFTSGTWGICTSPSSACPQPPLPLVLAHHIPPTYAGELERVWLAEKEKKSRSVSSLCLSFPAHADKEERSTTNLRTLTFGFFSLKLIEIVHSEPWKECSASNTWCLCSTFSSGYVELL